MAADDKCIQQCMCIEKICVLGVFGQTLKFSLQCMSHYKTQKSALLISDYFYLSLP